MTVAWLEELLQEYHKWLANQSSVQFDESTGWGVISTPFLGLFNDAIQIYVKDDGANILLSDDGETLRNLEYAGANVVSSARRREVLNTILLNYGTTLTEDNQIIMVAPKNRFAHSKHAFLSTLIELNDVYMLSRHRVASIFKEDVREYLDSMKITYTPDFISKGESGLEYVFDFQIAGQRREILIKTFNVLQKPLLTNFLFFCDDVSRLRSRFVRKDIKTLAFLNDEGHVLNPGFTQALTAKGADYILWSQRKSAQEQEKLAA